MDSVSYQRTLVWQYSPATGLSLITRFVHDWDTWNEKLDPKTITGATITVNTLGLIQDAFIFEQDEHIADLYIY